MAVKPGACRPQSTDREVPGAQKGGHARRTARGLEGTSRLGSQSSQQLCQLGRRHGHEVPVFPLAGEWGAEVGSGLFSHAKSRLERESVFQRVPDKTWSGCPCPVCLRCGKPCPSLKSVWLCHRVPETQHSSVWDGLPLRASCDSWVSAYLSGGSRQGLSCQHL